MRPARWACPLWPAFFEGWAVQMVARIELGPIGPTLIGLLDPYVSMKNIK